MAIRILVMGIVVSVIGFLISIALIMRTDSAIHNFSLGYQNPATTSTQAPQSSVPVTKLPSTGTLSGGATFTWTLDMTSSGGYSTSAELDVGSPEPFQAGLANGDMTAGSACSLNAQTDAVVPAIITLRNTSANFATTVGANFTGIGSGSIPSFTGPELLWEAAYASGPQCTGQGDNNSEFSLYTTNELAAGSNSIVDGFFDITNYYSTPISSNGLTLLGDTILTVPTSFSVTNNSTGSTTEFNVIDVTGPGVVQTASGWQFTLAGTNPPA